MSIRERASAILRETVLPFAARPSTIRLPDYEQLGRSVSGPTRDALLRFAIEHAVLQAMGGAEMASVAFAPNEHGLRGAALADVAEQHRPDELERVQMNIAFTFPDGSKHLIQVLVIQQSPNDVIVEIRDGTSYALEMGDLQPRPGGVVITRRADPQPHPTASRSRRPAHRAPAPSRGVERLRPGQIFRQYR